VKLPFVNREYEQRTLAVAEKRGGLLVVYGRRRVGKTRLLRHWLHARNGLYSQAIEAQRERVARLKQALTGCDAPVCRQLLSLSDYLVKKCVWILGGDGWA
jgi:pyruvate-ferredoxin/flavodoxin oxidoreductase